MNTYFTLFFWLDIIIKVLLTIIIGKLINYIWRPFKKNEYDICYKEIDTSCTRINDIMFPESPYNSTYLSIRQQIRITNTGTKDIDINKIITPLTISIPNSYEIKKIILPPESGFKYKQISDNSVRITWDNLFKKKTSVDVDLLIMSKDEHPYDSTDDKYYIQTIAEDFFKTVSFSILANSLELKHLPSVYEKEKLQFLGLLFVIAYTLILIASFSLHNKYNQDLVANSCIVEYKQNNDSTAIINRKVGVLRYEEKQSKIVLYNDKINKTELLSFTPQEFENNVSIKYNQEQLKAIDNQIRKEKKAFVVMTILDLLMIVIFLALSLKARGVSS